MTAVKLGAILATIVVGGIVAFQPPVNAQLGDRVGVLGAAFLSTVVGSVVLLVVFLAAGGGPSRLGDLGGVPWYELTGGLMGVVLITVSLVTVKPLGAGGVVAATVAGQLVVSALLDRAGVLGLDKVGLTPLRVAGFALVLLGTVLVTLPVSRG